MRILYIPKEPALREKWIEHIERENFGAPSMFGTL